MSLDFKDVNELANAQHTVLNVIYGNAPGVGTPMHKALNSAYEGLRDVLIEYHGGADQALCSLVDPALFEVFHNCFKSDHGMRPSGGWKYALVRQYLEQRKSLVHG